MSPELVTIFMFATMLVLLITGQRVFGVIGFVGAAAALCEKRRRSAPKPLESPRDGTRCRQALLFDEYSFAIMNTCLPSAILVPVGH